MCDTECYCDEDQGAGYSYENEFGDCDVCLQKEAEQCLGPSASCHWCCATDFCYHLFSILKED